MIDLWGFVTSSVRLIYFSFLHISTYLLSPQSGMIHLSCKMMHDSFSSIFKEGHSSRTNSGISPSHCCMSNHFLCTLQLFKIQCCTPLHQTVRSRLYYRVPLPVNVLTSKRCWYIQYLISGRDTDGLCDLCSWGLTASLCINIQTADHLILLMMEFPSQHAFSFWVIHMLWYEIYGKTQ